MNSDGEFPISPKKKKSDEVSPYPLAYPIRVFES
jgi:hypothetical protein